MSICGGEVNDPIRSRFSSNDPLLDEPFGCCCGVCFCGFFEVWISILEVLDDLFCIILIVFVDDFADCGILYLSGGAGEDGSSEHFAHVVGIVWVVLVWLYVEGSSEGVKGTGKDFTFVKFLDDAVHVAFEVVFLFCAHPCAHTCEFLKDCLFGGFSFVDLIMRKSKWCVCFSHA